MATAPVFDNTYARLPDQFHVRQSPERAPAPRLIRLNEPLAQTLGFDPAARSQEDWAQIFAGNQSLPGFQPLAMAYAGHQFGQFVPQLGDGRALLLGEVVDVDGQRRDVQLKGAGRTPFSRQGDGKAALGPVLREYVLSEAMHALGVPTTRALAAVATGETVYRETPLPGAILTRVASSHIRVGTFQYFAARGDTKSVRRLADYVIDRHYGNDSPGNTATESSDAGTSDNPYLALLEAFAARQARLVARWLGIGFIHGVMNTDNFALSGETIDYGPCAFMDDFDPATVFSSIDQMGRYAYGRQPQIAQWNLARFAETLLGLISDDEEQAVTLATEAVEGFAERFRDEWLGVMGAKLGLDTIADDDASLINDLLMLMQTADADFTLTFRSLADVARGEFSPAPLESHLPESPERGAWLTRWRTRLGDVDTGELADRMNGINPLYIPRNHLVEQMIDAAVANDDFAPFERMLAVLSRPFEEQDVDARYARPPGSHERVLQTFCGT